MQGDTADDISTDELDYIPRWASSSKSWQDTDDVSEEEVKNNDEESTSIDELPPFSDEESKALHREIKLLEARRDEASKSTRSHQERLDIIKDHLRSIRQDISHTNSIFAAKKSEVDAEQHLLSLTQRELGQYNRDVSGLDNDIISKQKKIKNNKNQILTAEDELEKLKIDLNWNQEELEQWATAAKKKEEEDLAIQKYSKADELKVKEYSLTIGNLTKILVEKKSLLDNEVTESRSNQTELQKLAERFKSRHDERRQLIHQWKDTVESMNSRDQVINKLSAQYAELSQKEEECQKILAVHRNQRDLLENNREQFQQDSNYKERLLLAKRQDLSNLQATEISLKTEVESLQREYSASEASVENKRAEIKSIQNGLQQRKEDIESLTMILENVKQKLAQEKLGTSSTEKIAETIEKVLVNREKELQIAEKNIANLKQKLYKDSQRLLEYKKKEAELNAEIKGAHASIKNVSSKVYDLESKKARQQELLYNTNFQLQQIEKKVSRGRGERSDVEKQVLLGRIEGLEKELHLEKQKKAMMIQQQRKIQTDLRIWNKKYDLSDAKYRETVQKINEMSLESEAFELRLKEVISKREETMVSHDVTMLDVRRLRDFLRNLLEGITTMKEQDLESTTLMRERKDSVQYRNEIKTTQIRAFKEERQKNAIQLGKLKVTLEKVKSKYDLICSINAGKNQGSNFESPELKLILVAQKKEELQQEGDALDVTIRKKQQEIRTMKKSLLHLREKNSKFRSSFAKADLSSAKVQELRSLEAKVNESEESLLNIRKDQQILRKSIKEAKEELEELTKKMVIYNEKNETLMQINDRLQNEAKKYSEKIEKSIVKVSSLKVTIHENLFGMELQLRQFEAELVDIQSDHLHQLLLKIGEDFPDLRAIINAEMGAEY